MSRARSAPTPRAGEVVSHAKFGKSKYVLLPLLFIIYLWKSRLISQCDECLPCSRCVKRNVQCQPSPSGLVIAPVLSKASPYLGVDLHPQISLLHLELFYHWDRETRSTLSFPQVWPVIMQRSFEVCPPSRFRESTSSLSQYRTNLLCPPFYAFPLCTSQLLIWRTLNTRAFQRSWCPKQLISFAKAYHILSRKIIARH